MDGEVLFGERSERDDLFALVVEVGLSDQSEMVLAYAFGLWFVGYHPL